MNIIDTHTHLYLPEFDTDDKGAGAVNRAIAAGVTHMVFPNVDFTTVKPMRTLAALYPGVISMAMGLHPTEVRECWSDDVVRVKALFDDTNDYVAVGEVGIDLYWDKTYEVEQMKAFEAQVALAKELDLPVIIHCREGLDQVLEVLREFSGIQAVFHSFGGTIADVERIRNVGDYYFGINGVVTFKNCKVREALPEITLDRFVLETDSPYLAAVPHRGKRNETAYVVHTAAYIADYMDISVDEVADRTSQNAKDIFRLP